MKKLIILRRVSTFIALGLLVGGCESLPQVFDLSDEQVKTAAKEITVIIDDCGSAGSGVIFKKDGNTYSVLTADHVVKKAKGNCVILKSDNSQYKASVSEAIVPVAGVDLAVLTFQSDKNHKLAKWGDSDKATDYTKVYVAGAPEPSQAIPNRIIRVEDGKIDNRKLQTNGYDLIYTNKTLRGMSGGPVLNQKGEVIGIHGQGDQDNGIKTGLKLGIPIKTFLKSDFAPKIDEDSSRLRIIFFRCYLLTTFVIIVMFIVSILAIAKALIFDNFNSAKRLAFEQITNYYVISFIVVIISFFTGNGIFYGVYFIEGIVRRELGDKTGMVTALDQAIKCNPYYSDAYKNRGNAKSALGRKQEAIADYDRAIGLDSNDAIAYNNRGIVKYDLGKKEEAIADYDRAIQLNSNFAIAYYNRGLANSALGKKEEAIADYQKAADLFKKQNKTTDYEKVLNQIQKLSAPISPSDDSPNPEKSQSESPNSKLPSAEKPPE
ncbi:MAG: tetratricopeptide repeat protein [Oscillatoriales cyanobacterium]|nr:MAG: tetratricopeptide repeat protein [Oscillatoriales cyanobacterium]TAH18628.1 MAG: tetratricopeptide repeat protein [Oscillatoriales cyanobacterium]